MRPIPQEIAAGPQSLTTSDFWEAIKQRNPQGPEAIHSLLTALEPLGVYPDIKASLNLKLDLPDREKPVSFGYITKAGQFWSNPAASSMPERVWRPYFAAIAEIVGGTVIDEPGNKQVAVNGRSAPRISSFLPQRQDEFVAAIRNAIRMLNEADDT